jgi:hypothetical protein
MSLAAATNGHDGLEDIEEMSLTVEQQMAALAHVAADRNNAGNNNNNLSSPGERSLQQVAQSWRKS